MIGNLPTIRTDKEDNHQVNVESSSGYSIPMVNEQEFNNSNIGESTKSLKSRKLIKQLSKNTCSVTDTYNLSPSSGSSNNDDNRDDDEDEPTDPFVQVGPSSPEVIEISSRYVEEVVSNTESEQSTPNKELVPYMPLKNFKIHVQTPVIEPPVSKAGIIRETPAALRLKRELTDIEKKKQVC